MSGIFAMGEGCGGGFQQFMVYGLVGYEAGIGV